jgi:5'-nucleotidase (lipoprotein e(P4) family)
MRCTFCRVGIMGLFLAALAGAFLGGQWVTAQAPLPLQLPMLAKTEAPPYRGLDAALYMQTSAEYRACCLQAYNLATLRLKEAMAAKPAGTTAVVLDLDETVFDNGAFQTNQLRTNAAYDQVMWDQWEETKWEQIGLIPGAKEFLLEADKLGVALAYITNRNDKFREATTKAIAKLGIPFGAKDILLLSKETSDKTARRAEVEKKHTVLLYVGDNLRDFDDAFRFAKFDDKSTPADRDSRIAARKMLVDKSKDVWGSKWIILPNPCYGEWTKPLGFGLADLDRLLPPPPKP